MVLGVGGRGRAMVILSSCGTYELHYQPASKKYLCIKTRLLHGIINSLLIGLKSVPQESRLYYKPGPKLMLGRFSS